MIDNLEQWYKSLDSLLKKLYMVRPSDRPSPYQVMTVVKKFLMTEKIGPQDLRNNLIGILNKGIMNTNADEMARHMRFVINEYKKNKFQEAGQAVQDNAEQKNTSDINLGLEKLLSSENDEF